MVCGKACQVTSGKAFACWERRWEGTLIIGQFTRPCSAHGGSLAARRGDETSVVLCGVRGVDPEYAKMC
jgi:hypothetical protein